jgi:lipid-A-disaccharide synthase
MKPIFVLAGEPSGDVLGAGLIQGLKLQYPGISFVGVGGPSMESAGSFTSIFPMKDISHMGFGPVIWNGRKILSRMYQTLSTIRQTDTCGLLTIDSPSFCMRISRRIKDRPRIHCVSPSVWAWKAHRAKSIVAPSTDQLLSLFPFEEPYYRHMRYAFVGHPICSTPKGDAQEFWKNHGPERPLLCLLPGSRRQEIKNFFPIFLETARRLKAAIPTLLVATVQAPGTEHLWPIQSSNAYLVVPSDQKHHLFAATTLALAASGTVTIELGHQGTPMVIGYQVSKPIEWMMRCFLTQSSVGLINIVGGQAFVPECLQGKFTPDFLAKTCQPFFSDPLLREEQSRLSLAAMSSLWAGDSFGALGARAIGQTFGLE